MAAWGEAPLLPGMALHGDKASVKCGIPPYHGPAVTLGHGQLPQPCCGSDRRTTRVSH